MKVTKYLALPIDVLLMGPYTLECTISKGLVVCLPLLFQKTTLYFLPLMHTSQNNEDVGQENLEGMNILHVQMAKAVMPKFERAISHSRLLQVSWFHFVHLYKIDLIQVVFACLHHCKI